MDRLKSNNRFFKAKICFRRGSLNSRAKHHETYLSTFRRSPQADPRFSGAHEDPRRPGGHQCPPRQRAQAPGRVILLAWPLRFSSQPEAARCGPVRRRFCPAQKPARHGFRADGAAERPGSRTPGSCGGKKTLPPRGRSQPYPSSGTGTIPPHAARTACMGYGPATGAQAAG